jgi:DNA-binding NarL/FixJ family response regulator
MTRDAMTLSCLIVDDSAPFLASARGLLERQGLTVVGVASTSTQALQQTTTLSPDVVLVDIGLGDESGFDLARRLSTGAARRPDVILISTRSAEDYADLIAQSPAIGFLPKSHLSGRAIHRLLGGQHGETVRDRA